MAKVMSLIFTIFLFTPIVAPFLGLAILSVSDWQMVFLAPPLFAAFVFLWCLRLDESLPADRRTLLNWASIGQSITSVVSNRVFRRYTLITTLLFTALSSYVSSSEHIVGEIYGRPELFAWIFAAIGALMAVFTLINSRLSMRFGARRSIRGLLACYAIVALFLTVYTYTVGDPPDMMVFFIAVGLLMAINLAIEPNSSSLAMEPMGSMAGMASAVYGTFFFFVGASTGSLISNLMVAQVKPLVFSFLAIGIISLALVLTDRHAATKNTVS